MQWFPLSNQRSSLKTLTHWVCLHLKRHTWKLKITAAKKWMIKSRRFACLKPKGKKSRLLRQKSWKKKVMSKLLKKKIPNNMQRTNRHTFTKEHSVGRAVKSLHAPLRRHLVAQRRPSRVLLTTKKHMRTDTLQRGGVSMSPFLNPRKRKTKRRNRKKRM